MPDKPIPQRPLTYDRVVNQLLFAIPEINSVLVRDGKSLYADNLPDVVYGDIFCNFIRQTTDKVSLCRSDGEKTALENLLRRAFELVEQLQHGEDFETRCLARVSILESLLGEKGQYDLFARFMGPLTKFYAKQLVNSWKINTNSFDK